MTPGVNVRPAALVYAEPFDIEPHGEKYIVLEPQHPFRGHRLCIGIGPRPWDVPVYLWHLVVGVELCNVAPVHAGMFPQCRLCEPDATRRPIDDDGHPIQMPVQQPLVPLQVRLSNLGDAPIVVSKLTVHGEYAWRRP